jgi:hypothetical protein
MSLQDDVNRVKRRGRKSVDDADDDRAYRLAKRRLDLLERRLRIYLSVTFVLLPFAYVLGSAIMGSFGVKTVNLNWFLLVPFMAAGIAFLFNVSLLDAFSLFGKVGTILSLLGQGMKQLDTGKGTPDGDDEEDAG